MTDIPASDVQPTHLRNRMDALERANEGVERRKRMMASGKKGAIATVCMHCHKGLTHSDDVLMALDPDARRSHGLHEGECAEAWERAVTTPDDEGW